MPEIDFKQPSQAPPIAPWTGAWYLSRVFLYRLLPLKWALMLCAASRHIEMQIHPARRRKLEALLKPLLPAGTSRRDLRRQMVLSRVVRRLGFNTHAAVFRRSRQWLLRTLRPEGLETLEQIKRDGRGAIILATHAGMNAWVGPVLIQLGYPMRLIQRRHWAPHELLLLRSDGWDSQVLPFPRAGDEGIHLKWLCDLVRQGEWIQHAADSPHPTGVAGRHLGHPVRCCRGPWAIARQTGVPLVPVLLLVDERCNPRLIIGSPIHVKADGPPGDSIACAFQSYLDFVDRHLRHTLWNLHLVSWKIIIAGAPPSPEQGKARTSPCR